MSKIIHDIPLITQGIQNCVQASSAQMLNFYDVNKTVEEIQKEVPVYIKDGVPIGTSLGHIAKYFIDQGFKTTLHVADIQIFDRSWKDAPKSEIINKLLSRQPHIKHHLYDESTIKFIIDGYVSFLQSGGEILFPVIDSSYLQKQLNNGPIFGVVSFNFLNDAPKYGFDLKNNKPFPDDIAGNTSTHAIVIAGYEDDRFLIVDPDYDFGGKKWVDTNRLVGAIYLADSDFDSLLITLEK